jgi:hypothetical protein
MRGSGSRLRQKGRLKSRTLDKPGCLPDREQTKAFDCAEPGMPSCGSEPGAFTSAWVEG